MGLHITAYKQIKEVEETLCEKCIEDDESYCTCNSDFSVDFQPAIFKKHLCNLKEDAKYIAEDSETCLSMSYGSYSAFREMLAELADYEDIEKGDDIEGETFIERSYRKHQNAYPKQAIAREYFINNLRKPFLELIFFSDCEGYIGTEYSQKLAEDFEYYAEKAKLLKDENEFFYNQYEMFRENIKLAADGGCLIFG